MRKTFMASLCILFLISCSNSSNNDYGVKITPSSSTEMLAFNEGEEYDQSLAQSMDDESDGSRDETSNNQPIPGQPQKKVETKIIKEGNIGIRVEDFGQSRTGLDELIRKYDGYVADENERKYSTSIESTIIIRLPAEHFDAFMESIGGLAVKVHHKRINAQDVTRQFVDIQSRLKLKKEVRDKYESFLKNAKNVEELLAIEREIRVLTEEIEAKEAELRYLSDRVGYSTITVEMNQRLSYEYNESEYAEPTFLQRIGKGFSTGWEGVLAFFVGLTYLWPLILLGIIIFLAIRKPTKRFLTRLFGTK